MNHLNLNEKQSLLRSRHLLSVLLVASLALTAASCEGVGNSSDTSTNVDSPHDNPDNSNDESTTVIGDSECHQTCTVLPEGEGFVVEQVCTGALQGATDGDVIFSETFPDNCTNIIEVTVTTTTLP